MDYDIGPMIQDEQPEESSFQIGPRLPDSSSRYPANYDDLVAQTAVKYGVDPDLAIAVHREEYNPNQWVSSAGARGPMQLMPDTAKGLGVKDIDDPEQNVDGGVRYLNQMLDMKGGSVPLALASYNAGPGKVNNSIPTYTSKYVNDIMNRADRLKANPTIGPMIPDDDQAQQPQGEIAQPEPPSNPTAAPAVPNESQPQSALAGPAPQPDTGSTGFLTNVGIGAREDAARVLGKLWNLSPYIAARLAGFNEESGTDATTEALTKQFGVDNAAPPQGLVANVGRALGSSGSGLLEAFAYTAASGGAVNPLFVKLVEGYPELAATAAKLYPVVQNALAFGAMNAVDNPENAGPSALSGGAAGAVLGATGNYGRIAKAIVGAGVGVGQVALEKPSDIDLTSVPSLTSGIVMGAFHALSGAHGDNQAAAKPAPPKTVDADLLSGAMGGPVNPARSKMEVRLEDGTTIPVTPSESTGQYFDGQGNAIDQGAVRQWRNAGEPNWNDVNGPVAPELPKDGTPTPIEAPEASTQLTPLDTQAHGAATSQFNDLAEPTQGQVEGNNYKKGHVTVDGLQISIENPRGSIRRNQDPNTPYWESTTPEHYGDIKGTIGPDGDPLDCYVGPDRDSQKVFLVDQIDPKTQKFDETKTLFGYTDPDKAIETYTKGFSDGSGESRIGQFSELTMSQYKDWLKNGDTTKAYAYGTDENTMPAGVSGLATHETALSESPQQGLQPVRGAGDNNLPRVGERGGDASEKIKGETTDRNSVGQSNANGRPQNEQLEKEQPNGKEESKEAAPNQPPNAELPGGGTGGANLPPGSEPLHEGELNAPEVRGTQGPTNEPRQIPPESPEGSGDQLRPSGGTEGQPAEVKGGEAAQGQVGWEGLRYRLERTGTAYLPDTKTGVKIVKLDDGGFGVTTTVKGDRRPHVEEPLKTIEEARDFAMEQLKNPRPASEKEQANGQKNQNAKEENPTAPRPEEPAAAGGNGQEGRKEVAPPKVKTYGYDRIKMTQNLSLDDLKTLRESVEQDPKNRNPEGSFNIYTDAARKKLDNIAWAVTNVMRNAKAEAKPGQAVKQPWERTLEEVESEKRQEVGDKKWYGTEADIKRKAADDWYDTNEKAYIEGKDVPFKNRPAWSLTAEEVAKRSDDVLDDNFREDHKGWVEQALSEGKPVPPEVLKDYPDLVAKPEVKITPQPEGDVVKTDIPKAEAEKLTPKEQKTYLLNEIDVAIKGAKSGRDIEGTPEKITFEVPGDGKFTIPHSKENLEEFKKKVNSGFPTTTETGPRPLKSLPTGRSSGRISSEDVSYYNEFKPRKTGLDTWIRQANRNEKTAIHSTKDGFITDTRIAVLPNKKVPALLNDDLDVHSLVGEDAPEIIKVAEFKSPNGTEPLAHLVNAEGKDIFANPKLMDVVLSEHPDAKMFAEGDGSPIAFRDKKGNLVGAIMPIVDGTGATTDWVKENQRDFTEAEHPKTYAEEMKDRADEQYAGWGNRLASQRGSIGEGGPTGQYPGIRPTSEIVSDLRNFGSSVKDSLSHLVELGANVIKEGAQTLSDFTSRMKDHLGDMYEKYKPMVIKAWQQAKDILNNERGSIGERAEEERPPGGVFGEEKPRNSFTGDAKEAAVGVRDAVKAAGDDFARAFSPMSRGEAAEKTGRILRENLAEEAQKADRAEAASREAARFFDGQPKSDKLAFIDNIETGRGQPDDNLKGMAATLRGILDERVRAVRDLGTGKLQHLIENYFPHLWKDPDKANQFIADWYSKRPMEGRGGFLKSRSIPTIAEGIAAGLEPVDYNPITLMRLKVREIDKYVMAHKSINEMSERGLGYWQDAREKIEDGMTLVNDKIATQWKGSKVSVRDVLDEFAKGSRYELFKKDFGSKVMADEDARAEIPGQFHGEVRRGGKSYTEQIVRSFLSDPDTFRQKAPNIYRILEESSKGNPELQQLWKVPKFDDENLRLPVGGIIKDKVFVMPQEAAQVINNYLSPGLREKSALFRGYLTTANIMNQVQLGLSAFHAGFTSLDAMVSTLGLARRQLMAGDFEGAGASALKTATMTAPIFTARLGGKVRNEWFNPGSESTEIQNIVSALRAGGGRARMDDFYRTHITQNMMQLFRDAKEHLGNGELGSALWAGVKGAARAPFSAIEQQSRPILEWLVPRQKLGVFADLMGHELKMKPDMTHEEIRQTSGKIWDSVDNRLGMLVYDNLFWNKTAKDIGMASVRSLGWNLGDIRELGGAGVDTLKAVKNLATGKSAEFSYKMDYALALPLVVGSLGALTNYLMTGEAPQDLKDLFAPRTGRLDPNGNPERVWLPSYVKDIYHMSVEPIKTIEAKLHPMLNAMAEMWQNHDYYRTKIRNEDDPIVQQVLDSAKHMGQTFEPFALRNIQREMDTSGGKLTPSTLLPMIGITPAPKSINETPAERQMDKEMAAHQEAGGRTKEQATRSQGLAVAANALKSGDVDTFGKTVGDLADKGLLKQKDLENIRSRATTPPLVSRFKMLATGPKKDPDAAVRVFAKASPDERAELMPDLQKMITGLKNTFPEQYMRVLGNVAKVF